MSKEQLTKTRQMILDRFLSCLERSPGEWQKQWIAPRPMQNGNTGKAYRGINQLLLSNVAEERGYQDCRWYTFHQVNEAGWHLQNAKGHGVPIEYWSPYDTVDKKMVSWKEMHRLLREQEREDGDFSLRCKTYTVFNGDLIPELEPLPVQQTKSPEETNELAEKALLTYLQNSGVTLYAENPSMLRAFYRPSEDAIYLPVREHFFSLGGYFGTAFHEVAHSTAHPNRLNRTFGKEFGDDVYAKEELIAEIASTLICGELGLSGDDLLLENHEAYVQGWISDLQEKPSILFSSIQSAQKAADYVLETAEVEKLREAMQEQRLEDRYTIYQVKEENLRDCGFLSYGLLSKLGHNVSKDRYQEVYSDTLEPGTTLDELFRKFNVDHPADYTGRSLSVSDVVVLLKKGKKEAYYCDNVGWKEVPEFLKDAENVLGVQSKKPTRQRKEDISR